MRKTLAILTLLAAAGAPVSRQAHAADVYDQRGRRVESIRPYPNSNTRSHTTYDRIDPRTGNHLGTVRELSPGSWHLLDRKGNTVWRIQCPPRENCLGR